MGYTHSGFCKLTLAHVKKKKKSILSLNLPIEKKAQTCKFIYRHPTTTWFLEAEDIYCLSQQNESLVCINDERENYLTVISSSLNQDHYTRSKFNDTHIKKIKA